MCLNFTLSDIKQHESRIRKFWISVWSKSLKNSFISSEVTINFGFLGGDRLLYVNNDAEDDDVENVIKSSSFSPSTTSQPRLIAPPLLACAYVKLLALYFCLLISFTNEIFLLMSKNKTRI